MDGPSFCTGLGFRVQGTGPNLVLVECLGIKDLSLTL